MTPDYDFEETVTTAAEFEAVLGQLLAGAEANGVDVSGSWVHGADGSDDWEVLILKLARE